jgi:hypothetical protein
MTRKTLLLFIFISLHNWSISQTNSTPSVISKHGYANVVIGHTLIKEVLLTGKFRIDTINYLWGLANMGGGCIRIEQTKIFYRCKELGITYIISRGDTISGIIFYPPFAGQTNKGEIIRQTEIASLNIPKRNNKIKYAYPDVLGLHRDKAFAENAKHYVVIDDIYYGFKNKRRTISEIRIGE